MDGVQGGKEQNCWVVELWLPFIPELNRCVDIRARAAAGEVSGRQAMGWVSLWRGWVGAWQVCVCVEGGGEVASLVITGHSSLRGQAGGWQRFMARVALGGKFSLPPAGLPPTQL